MNDKQILKKLTEDVINYRTFAYGGVSINRRHCLIEGKSEFLKPLLEEGKIIRERPNSRYKFQKCSSGRTTRVVGLNPTEKKPTCLVCKNSISCAPEISMTEHKIDCRLRVYYFKPPMKLFPEKVVKHTLKDELFLNSKKLGGINERRS